MRNVQKLMMMFFLFFMFFVAKPGFSATWSLDDADQLPVDKTTRNPMTVIILDADSNNAKK